MSDKTIKVLLIFLTLAVVIFLQFYGIDTIVLNSDELHPARTLISDDWSLTDYPWPEESEREFFDNWPIQFPPVFGLLTRLAVVIFGVNHFALRFFPALFAVAAALVAYSFFRLYLKSGAAFCAALLLGAASDKLILYAKSLKHYTADVLLSLVILLFGRLIIEKGDAKYWFWFTVFAVTGIWLAFASIFVIAAVFAVLLLQKLLNRESSHPRFWTFYLISGFAFALSFGALYVINIANAVTNPVFLEAWEYQIFVWDKVTDIGYVVRYILHMGLHVLRLPVYFFIDSLFLAVIVNFFIIVYVVKNIKTRSWLDLLFALLPLLLMLLASVSGRYPFFAGRLSLFLLPLWILMAVSGYRWLCEKVGKKSKTGYRAAVLLGIGLILYPVWINIGKVHQQRYAGGRRVDQLMHTMKQNARDGDTVFLHWGSILPFYFYFSDHSPGYRAAYPIGDGTGSVNVIYGSEYTFSPEKYETQFERVGNIPGRLWIAFCHMWPTENMEALEKSLEAGRRRIDTWEFKGCKLLLYESLE